MTKAQMAEYLVDYIFATEGKWQRLAKECPGDVNFWYSNMFRKAMRVSKPKLELLLKTRKG